MPYNLALVACRSAGSVEVHLGRPEARRYPYPQLEAVSALLSTLTDHHRLQVLAGPAIGGLLAWVGHAASPVPAITWRGVCRLTRIFLAG